MAGWFGSLTTQQYQVVPLLILIQSHHLKGFPIKTIVGKWQNIDGTPVAGGRVFLKLSQDAVANGTSQVSTALISFNLDSNGSIVANSSVWANDELSPSGTTYSISVIAAGGGTVWGAENIYLAGLSPINLNNAVPSAGQSVILSNAVITNPAAQQTISNFPLDLSGTLLGFSPAGSDVIDTGVSRTAASTVAIGNGSQGDESGTLKAAKLNAVTGFQQNSGATSGHVLRGNGTNFVDAALAASDLSNSTTGSGAVVLQTSPTITTPHIASIINTGTLTLPTSTDTLVGRATTDTLTNKTLTSPVISTIVNTGTLTLPTSTDTLVGKATTDILTNKTLDTAGTGNVLKINGTQVSAVTGSGAVVLATSPTLTTPNIGAATGTSLALGGGTALTTTNGTGSGALVLQNSPTLTGTTSIDSTGSFQINSTLGGSISLGFNSPASGGFVSKFQNITDVLVYRTSTDTLTNKTLTAPVISSIVNTGTLTLPTSTDTLVGRATTDTLTNKRLSPRVTTLTTSTTFTPDGDNSDLTHMTMTGVAGTLTIAAPTGTPTDGQKLTLRIKTTNAQTYSFNATYRFSTTVTAPTSTTAGKTDYIGTIWNAVDSKWDVVAYDSAH